MEAFSTWHYIRHNQRRQEHLATLGLPLAGRSVLELGAGVGDHTTFFLDRGCMVVTTEGRPENYQVLAQRFPDLQTHLLDMEDPQVAFSTPFDVVYCYGLLYHLRNPVPALDYLARYCRHLLLLETCVSAAQPDGLNPCAEPQTHPTQAVSGTGCRPGRAWVFQQLQARFPHVYLPLTQPWHEEFPIDWTAPATLETKSLTRSIFIASREPLDNPQLRPELLMQQCRS